MTVLELERFGALVGVVVGELENYVQLFFPVELPLMWWSMESQSQGWRVVSRRVGRQAVGASLFAARATVVEAAD